MSYIFGIDLGGTTVKIGIFDELANIIEQWEIPTRQEENGKYIIPDMANSINEKIKEHNFDKKDIKGVGIGIPGPVDDNGIVIKFPNLGWKNMDISKELGNLINIPVKVENDANVAALGEMWQGGAKGYKNVVFVTLGTGVGGGIIINNKLINGSHGAGGEIGHIKVKFDETQTCGCGGHGCLEQYASATGIVRMTKELLKESSEPSSLRDIENITAKDILDAAKNSDKIANEIVDKFGFYLGSALANIAAIVDPEIFIIGGGVSKAGKILIDSIEKYYQKCCFSSCANVKFAIASLGNSAGIYGAAKLIVG